MTFNMIEANFVGYVLRPELYLKLHSDTTQRSHKQKMRFKIIQIQQRSIYSCPALLNVILTSTAHAPFPSSNTKRGFISNSSISGNSVTSCESLCKLSIMLCKSEGFSLFSHVTTTT